MKNFALICIGLIFMGFANLLLDEAFKEKLLIPSSDMGILGIILGLIGLIYLVLKFCLHRHKFRAINQTEPKG